MKKPYRDTPADSVLHRPLHGGGDWPRERERHATPHREPDYSTMNRYTRRMRHRRPVKPLPIAAVYAERARIAAIGKLPK